MLRHGCGDQACPHCPRGTRRPTVYAARALAQQHLLTNKRLCPSVSKLFVPLINFSRPAAPESLIMRIRSGKPPKSESPPQNRPIGIMVRPQHVHKQQTKKTKDPIKEKPVKDVGQYKLRRLSGQTMEKVSALDCHADDEVIEITNHTKDDSFLQQILTSLSDVRLLTQSFTDAPKYRVHRNIITNQASVHLVFDELDRRHLPVVFDALYRAVHDPEFEEATCSQQIHIMHLAWQALASSDSALEIGGRPLAMTLVDLGTGKARLEALSTFIGNYEMLCAEPIINIIQSLLVYRWDGEYTVEGFRGKCLKLLKYLYHNFSTNTFLAPLFENDTVGKTALSERHQRRFAEAFSHPEETILDHPYLFTPSQKFALFEFWVVSSMENQHKQGWGLRRVARHFQNMGFRYEPHESAYFGIKAERQDLLHQVTEAITKRPISVLRKPMKVKYESEQGIDLAGLTADLLSRVIKQSITRCLKLNLLRESIGVWFQEGASSPQEFRRLGMLIGLAMYNGVKSLPLDFPPMFYKKLVDEPLELGDMIDFDPELYRGWQHLFYYDVEGLYFEYTYKLEEIVTFVMEWDGDKPKMVTRENRGQYIQALFKTATSTLISDSFNALQEGLESIIPRRVLRLFNSFELQSLLAGQRVIDVEETVEQLKRVTVYDGYTAEDSVIQNLWTVLSSGTPTQFSQFLDLITASDRIPASFPANFRLSIFKSGTDEEMLPRGQTCMHGLGLPAYGSLEKLKEKLFMALESFSAPGGDAFHLD